MIFFECTSLFCFVWDPRPRLSHWQTPDQTRPKLRPAITVKWINETKPNPKLQSHLHPLLPQFLAFYLAFFAGIHHHANYPAPAKGFFGNRFGPAGSGELEPGTSFLVYRVRSGQIRPWQFSCHSSGRIIACGGRSTKNFVVNWPIGGPYARTEWNEGQKQKRSQTRRQGRSEWVYYKARQEGSVFGVWQLRCEQLALHIN